MIDTSTIIMISAAVVLFVAAYVKSPDSAFRGLGLTRDLLIQVTPRLLAAFVIAGLVQVLVPQELVVQWMGKESGFKGILIGTALGGLTPGGPMTHFPILASFYQMGEIDARGIQLTQPFVKVRRVEGVHMGSLSCFLLQKFHELRGCVVGMPINQHGFLQALVVNG